MKKMCQIAAMLSAKKGKLLGGAFPLLLIVLLSVPGWADPPPLDDLVARVQENYEKMNDMKASFTQEVTIKSIRKTEREEGLFYFKNPLMMRWDYTLPKPKKLIINEKEMWLYLPADRTAYVQNTGDALKSKMIIKFLSGIGNIREDFQIQYSQPDPVDKNGDYLLTLIPRIKDGLIERLSLTIEKSGMYVKECRFADSYGNATRLTFKNLRLNSGIPLKLFTFTPPKGIEIVHMPR